MTPTQLIRRSALVLAAVGVSAGFAACGDDDTSGASGASAATASSGKGSAKAGSLVVGDASIADNLDPDSASASASGNLNIVNNAYEPLVNYRFKANPADQGGGEILDSSGVEPGLAESWTLEDGKATFKLRKGVKSTAGNEFTAADVKWTYDRNQAIKGTGLYILTNPARIKSLKVVDDYTVEYTTDGAAPLLLVALAGTYTRILDSTEAKKHVTSSDKWAAKWLAKNTAGFGAYDVSAYTPSKSVDLKPAANYWNGAPQNAIKMLPIADASSRYSSLEKGDINVALGLTPQQDQQAAKVDTLHLFRARGNTRVTIYPNWGRVKAFQNKLVRQAMQYAMPQDEIAKSVYLGYSFPLKSTLPSYLAGFDDQYWPYSYDVEKAKALMKEAGYEKGFTVKLNYSSDSAGLTQLAPIVQSSLEQIGVKLELVATPSSQILTRMFGKKDMDAFMLDLGANVLPDLSNIGSLWGTGLYGNTTGYSNKEFDAAVAESVSSTDLAVREPAWAKIQKIVADDPPVLEIVGIEYVAVGSGNVSGYRWVPDGGFQMSKLTVSSGE